MAIKAVVKEITIELSGDDVDTLVETCRMAEKAITGSTLWRDYIEPDERDVVLDFIDSVRIITGEKK